MDVRRDFRHWAVRICQRHCQKGARTSCKEDRNVVDHYRGILYLILMITLGVMSIRKGHWVMFIIGFFLPFFWLIGALMPSRRLAY